jgi:hypothetical protein
MWPSLLKIQYTELKLSCGNDPTVKNSIYSNGDLDLWPNDPVSRWAYKKPINTLNIKVKQRKRKRCDKWNLNQKQGHETK